MSAAPHTAATMVKTSSMVTSLPEAVASTQETITKVLCVKISGSPDALTMMGENSATWSVVDGRQSQVFGPSTTGHADMGAEQIGNMVDLNSDMKASVKQIRVLSMDNGFYAHLGINLSGLPRNEHVDTGESYTFTALPNSSITTPFVVYQAGAMQNDAAVWRSVLSLCVVSLILETK